MLYPLHIQMQPVWYPCYYGCPHAETLRQLFLCEFVCVSVCACVCVCGSVLFAALCVFLLVVEVIWKECSGKGGPSRPLNQQGRASNESVALTRADAN